MTVFSLTGGIGTGKSTVAKIWSESLPIVDADMLARVAVMPSSRGLKEIVTEFGQDVIINGELDRKKLGLIVFNNEEKLKKLNSILHPKVHALAEAHFERLYLQGHRLICYMVPLLFETGQEEKYRPVVVVSANYEDRLQRIILRDGLSQEMAIKKIESQLDLKYKEDRADFVIRNSNDCSHKELSEKAETTLLQIKNLQKEKQCPEKSI